MHRSNHIYVDEHGEAPPERVIPPRSATQTSTTWLEKQENIGKHPFSPPPMRSSPPIVSLLPEEIWKKEQMEKEHKHTKKEPAQILGTTRTWSHVLLVYDHKNTIY